MPSLPPLVPLACMSRMRAAAEYETLLHDVEAGTFRRDPALATWLVGVDPAAPGGESTGAVLVQQRDDGSLVEAFVTAYARALMTGEAVIFPPPRVPASQSLAAAEPGPKPRTPGSYSGEWVSTVPAPAAWQALARAWASR